MFYNIAERNEDTLSIEVSANTSKVSADGSLDTHNDVKTSSPVDGNLLQYNASSASWVNRPVVQAIFGSYTTTDMLNISSPTTGTIVYNSTLNKTCVYNGTDWMVLSDYKVGSNDLLNKNTTSMLTSAIGSFRYGVTNALYYGSTITVRAATNMFSGTVVSFSDLGSATDEFSVTYCKGSNEGEETASSQALGVLLEDAVSGNSVRIATSGICTCWVNAALTSYRGAKVSVIGTQGRVTVASNSSNQACIGMCLSSGTIEDFEAILVYIAPSYECY
jgi:predicted RecA/RadA family phage recombinase